MTQSKGYSNLSSPLARCAFAVLVSVSLCLGCGDGKPKRVTVAGTVLLDGKPLQQGNLIFVPENGRASNAKIGPDGRFKLRCYDEDDGALLGTHRVAVSAKKIISENNIQWYAPARYSDYRTSGITIEITESVDDLEIPLTTKPEEPAERQ